MCVYFMIRDFSTASSLSVGNSVQEQHQKIQNKSLCSENLSRKEAGKKERKKKGKRGRKEESEAEEVGRKGERE